jgi:hypothetical protein
VCVGAGASEKEKRNAYDVSVRIPGGRSPLGKPRHRLMNYIKICLKERG